MTSTDRYDPLGLGGNGPASTPPPRIRIAAPTTGPEEADAVTAVLESGILTNGPVTKQFEAAMADRHQARHAVAMANGTVALAAMLLAAGIEPGDEVIVPSFTFISTATSVLHVGATPVFADIRPDTFDLDAVDVARRVTPRTKAVMPVHYGGQAADMTALGAVAADAGLTVLEDAAQAHGAAYGGRPVGTWGQSAMFSFTPTKNITTGEGAIVTTNDDDVAHRLRLLRNHGMSAPYHHEILGWNWRLTEMQAAMGVCQVGRLDGILAAKRRHAAILDEALAGVDGVTTPTRGADRGHTYMLYTVLIDGGRRDAVRDALADAGVEARVYFPPVHLQPVFAGVDVDLPVTEDVAARALSLPVHAHLSEGDLAEVAGIVADAVGR